MSRDTPNLPASKFANLKDIGVINRHGVRILPDTPAGAKCKINELEQKVASLQRKLTQARQEIAQLKKGQAGK